MDEKQIKYYRDSEKRGVPLYCEKKGRLNIMSAITEP